MTERDPLGQAVLDLHALLGPTVPLILGGGYGLFVKQNERKRTGVRTIFAAGMLPDNRTTHDIDLFLRAEIVVSPRGMKSVRGALDVLDFKPIPGRHYFQFQKAIMPAGQVKVDLMVGPLGDLFDPKTVKRDERRVRPRAYSELHAHPTEEAIGVEEHLQPISISGIRSDGSRHTAIVFVPQAYTYLLMKLMAFRDRWDEERKDLARQHAIDIYRIVGLITEKEDEIVRDMANAQRQHPKVLEARAVVAKFFNRPDSLGILRMREHPLSAGRLNTEALITELAAILPPLPAT